MVEFNWNEDDKIIPVSAVAPTLDEFVERNKYKHPEKIEYLLNRLAENKDTIPKKNKKIFNLFARKGKKADKTKDGILVLHLTARNSAELIIAHIYGNLIIINNRVHMFDPRAVMPMKTGIGKNTRFIVLKELDRRPVSNLNLAEIRETRNSTENDQLMIATLLKASIEPQKKKVNVPVWLWIVIAAIAVGAIYLFMVKGP